MTENLLNTFIDKLPEGVLVVDSEGMVEMVNHTASQLLHRSKNTLEGFGLDKTVNLKQEDILNRLKACSRSRQPIPVSLPFLDEKGSVFKFKVTGFLFTPAIEHTLCKIMLRLTKADSSSSQFITLNKEIQNQHKTLRLLKNSQKELLEVSKELNNYINVVDKYLISSATDKNGNIVVF